MSKRCSINRCRVRLLSLAALIALLLGLTAPPPAALAHPLDAYLQATYLTVQPTQIVVELNLTPGVLLAPQLLPLLDPDGDQQITDSEGQTYVDALINDLVLQVDGEPLALTVTKVAMPPHLNIQAGYGTIRVFAAGPLRAELTGTHQIDYRNSFAPPGSIYQVNAFVDKGTAITLGKQNRDSLQQSMTMDFTIGSPAPAAAIPATAIPAMAIPAAPAAAANAAAPSEETADASGQAQFLLTYLNEPTRSPWMMPIALALACVLGALHALTPGHGKALVAAYLVGSRGTVRHAAALGAVVTFTHTASVIVIGLLALFASNYIVPDLLVPLLEIFSGLLVVILGVRLIRQRWPTLYNNQRPQHAHSHGHEHSHSHSDDHGHSDEHGHSDDHGHPHEHDHGDGHRHTHLPPAQGITLGNLVTMGVSGGLVPCPEALGIMVIAIGLNRILLGLGLIISFSFGLAAVLILIGVLLVRSRTLVERIGGVNSRWISTLPLVSAVIVTLLGVGITLSGLAAYLG